MNQMSSLRMQVEYFVSPIYQILFQIQKYFHGLLYKNNSVHWYVGLQYYD